MRCIKRGPEPEILRANKKSKKSWADVVIKANAGAEIRQLLLKMQKNICAYCEIILGEDNLHIEHFYPKSTHKDLTFSWDNLFASCNFLDSCGKYKDQKPHQINLDEVCKPDELNPEKYLFFVSTGRVRAKEDLDKEAQKIAQNTIQVFNLNTPRLVNERKSAIAIIYSEVMEYLNYRELMKGLSCEDQRFLECFKKEVMENLGNCSFPTALNHLWDPKT